MHRTLLMFGAIAANVEFIEHIEDLEVGAARITEQTINPFGAQRGRQDLGTALRVRAILRANRG